MRIHAIRHIVSHTMRKHKRGELIDDSRVNAGMPWRDAVCVVAALGILVGAALYVQHLYELDADVLYDAGAAIGAHPLSRAFRRGLDLII